MTPNFAPKIKRQRELKRAERREAKVVRRIERRADKLAGVPIDTLPPDVQGLARFISGADQ